MLIDMATSYILNPLEQFELTNLVGIQAPVLGYYEFGLTNLGSLRKLCADTRISNMSFRYYYGPGLILILEIVAGKLGPVNPIVMNHWNFLLKFPV